MAKSKKLKTWHTPGPWEAIGVRIFARQAIIADCDPYHTIYQYRVRKSTRTSHANARLMAAAPDFLDVCNIVLSVIKTWPEASSEANLLRSVIRKATGVALGLMIALSSMASSAGQQVIAQDSAGLVIEVKEKYGALLTDTCTVIMEHDGDYVLVHRDRPSDHFPTCNHSVRIFTLARTRDREEVK